MISKFKVENTKLWVGLLVVLFSLVFVSPVSAHVLETDGEIGAVMHVDPNDEPVVGQPAQFYFEIKDRTGKFKEQECDCQLSIWRGGQQIFMTPLVVSSAKFTFLEAGSYNVKLTGKPVGAVNFQPFELGDDLQVSQATKQATWWQQPSVVTVVLLGVVGLMVYFGSRLSKKRADFE